MKKLIFTAIFFIYSIFTVSLYADQPLSESEINYKVTKEVSEFIHDYQKYGGSNKNIDSIKTTITNAYTQKYTLKNNINTTKEEMYVKVLTEQFNPQEFAASQKTLLDLSQQQKSIMQKAYFDILSMLDLHDREAIVRTIHDDDHTIASGANHD